MSFIKTVLYLFLLVPLLVLLLTMTLEASDLYNHEMEETITTMNE